MKIGLISDVHAQLDALHRALDILERQGVDRILCAGDLVDKGPDGDAVVKTINDLLIPCVQGNHDLGAIKHHELEPDELQQTTVELLSQLPAIRQYTLHKYNVTLAHGTPMRHDSYCFPHKVPRDFRKWAAQSSDDVVILGHTHRPMLMRYGALMVINPGSVCRGRSRDSHTCALWDTATNVVRFFDLESAKQIAGLPLDKVEATIPICP